MRVVIAEDSVLLREGIARLLTEAGYEVVGQAGDAEDLMRKVRAHKPDEQLLGDGAEGVGYLLKDRVEQVDRFVGAVQRVGQGGTALDADVVAQMVGRKQDDPLDQLTPRERQVLDLMAQGFSNKAICAELVLSERAVERHITGVLSKLEIPTTGQEHRRVLAVLAYLRG